MTGPAGRPTPDHTGEPGSGPAGAAPAGDGHEVIRLEGLQVHFPVRTGWGDRLAGRGGGVVRAVDGVDLAIRSGEVLALVGESGSGKTTIGRVIVKLTRQTAGRILLDGKDVSGLWGVRALRAYRRRVQIVFQDPYETLNPRQSIFDFVAEPLVVNHIGASAEERRQRVLAALDAAGLRPAEEFAARFPHELSGGQRQRVVIAGALVMEPHIVVADEPVSMLDVSIRTELLRLMLDLRAERNLAYLFITHDLSLAWVIADRIAVLYLGRVMEIGSAEQVIRSAHHPYTAALVSVSPTPDPPEEAGAPVRTILVGETPDAAHVPAGCRFHPRCPLVFDRCRTEAPPLFEVGDGQAAACWLAEGGRALPVLPTSSPVDAIAPAPGAPGPAAATATSAAGGGSPAAGPSAASPGQSSADSTR